MLRAGRAGPPHLAGVPGALAAERLPPGAGAGVGSQALLAARGVRQGDVVPGTRAPGRQSGRPLRPGAGGGGLAGGVRQAGKRIYGMDLRFYISTSN